MKILHSIQAGALPCRCEEKKAACGEFEKYDVTIRFSRDTELKQGEICFGLLNPNAKSEEGFLMTHDSPVRRYRLPFAFPAIVSVYDDGTYALAVFDYFKTSDLFRNAVRDRVEGGFLCGIENAVGKVKAQTKYRVSMYVSYGEKKDLLMTQLIGKCAAIVLNEFEYARGAVGGDYTYHVKNYAEAARGLTNNLCDRRAIIQDGVGTFNPYGYHEIGAYTESFAAMDVAKGLYRYALIANDKEGLALIKKELYKLVNQDAKYKWIDTAHNTEGFFHLAWGAIPQDSGVAADYERKDLFSDFDGHEEGPNLLSTFKYFDRVELLGEMALLEGDEKLKEGFARTLPFIKKLRMPDYSQPVTYDLDSHEPKTGKEGGGSAGGAATWANIQFVAYELFRREEDLQDGLKAVDACNKLDYSHMFSMRCAPKPIALGQTVRANVLAYRYTKDKKYIAHAEKIAQGLFAHYYISPHPFTYFSAMGFGYACARERWEAFREMIETLWLASPVLEYSEDRNVLALYALAKQNVLWALPINGNPCGNLERDYESIGGEYIPFEFPTGHIGDNPGLEGGCQASQRQIKEIYGCGEVYLAYCLFEAYAQSFNKKILVINPFIQMRLDDEDRRYILYNFSDSEECGVINFKNLKEGMYRLAIGNDEDICSDTALKNGIVVTLKPGQRSEVRLVPTDRKAPAYRAEKVGEIRVSGFEKLHVEWPAEAGATHYAVCVQNTLNRKKYFTVGTGFDVEINRELDNTVWVVGYGKEGSYTYEKQVFGAVRKVFASYRDFSKTDDLAFENLTTVADGHMYMVYSVDPAIRSGKMEIPFGKKQSGYDLLQLKIASRNNGTQWSCALKGGRVLREKSGEIGLFEFDISDIPEGQDLILVLEAESGSGLGFSVSRLMVLRQESCKEPVLPVCHAVQTGKTVVKATLPKGYKFVQAAIKIESLQEEVQFYLDGEVLLSSKEKEFPIKTNRGATGVYRFEVNSEKESELEIVMNCEREFVKAIVMTSDNSYQIYTDYFEQEGKDDEI